MSDEWTTTVSLTYAWNETEYKLKIIDIDLKDFAKVALNWFASRMLEIKY